MQLGARPYDHYTDNLVQEQVIMLKGTIVATFVYLCAAKTDVHILS